MDNYYFNTNGVNVWDKNNSIMPNGVGLWGSSTTTHSALIIKKPGSPNLFYIFTLDFQGGEEPDSTSLIIPVPGAFAYSIIDMNQNGGLGDLIVKNH